MLRKSAPSPKEQLYQGQLTQPKLNNVQPQITDYINFLRSQIKHLGGQIDFEFQRSSQFIYSLYKHLYSHSQCLGQKATFLNKLSSCGVQWALTSAFQTKNDQIEGKSQEARSINQNVPDSRDQENNKKAYNMRAKTNKPQKYKYGLEDQYQFEDKNSRVDIPRRGRPAIKKQYDVETKRVEQPNPYEKAPYKKRKPVQVVDENPEKIVKEESPVRDSNVNDSSEDKGENRQKREEQFNPENPEKEKQKDNTDKAKSNVNEDQKHQTAGSNHDIKGQAEKAYEQKPISQLVLAYLQKWRQGNFEITIESDI